MKKKIAVIANGWSNEIVANALEGMKRCAQEVESDIFLFLSYASWGNEATLNEAQNSVFKLPRMEEFDGAIILSNVLNASYETVQTICNRIVEAGIPVISVGMEFADAGFIVSDNTIGMRDLAMHMFEKADVNRVVYVGGSEEHPDCRQRLEIAQEVAAQYGKKIADEDIYYSDWSFVMGREIAFKICDEKGIPDAIICANDYMALAVASGLLERGYSLPEDVYISGFDYVREGQDFYPALSSVSQNYEEIGYKACRWIYDVAEGKNPERVIEIPSQSIAGESTLGPNVEYDNKRRKIGQQAYFNEINELLLQERIGRVEGAILRSKSVDELKGTLAWYYGRGDQHEGDSFYMVMERDFFNSVYEHRVNISDIKICEQKLVVVAIKNKEKVDVQVIDRNDLIPGYVKDEESHIYCFAPLHQGGDTFGYMVFVDNDKFVRQRKITTYTGRIQYTMERFRNNLYVDMVNKELLEVSTTDSLTGLHNRFAYTQIVLPMFEESQKNKEKMAVVFIDINFMKVINDKFGHLQGDLALRIVADTIKKYLPENWVALRYGGDEFMLFGKISEGINIDSLETDIRDGILRAKEEMALPYDLSISYGHTFTDDTPGKQLREYVREADVHMYTMKKIIHDRIAGK
ncbi:MAG: GGDEF domain-containing protein [Acetatifactor sp.]|nr:GGDEF domain-containing protein [Acetatifactor sp.]